MHLWNCICVRERERECVEMHFHTIPSPLRRSLSVSLSPSPSFSLLLPLCHSLSYWLTLTERTQTASWLTISKWWCPHAHTSTWTHTCNTIAGTILLTDELETVMPSRTHSDSDTHTYNTHTCKTRTTHMQHIHRHHHPARWARNGDARRQCLVHCWAHPNYRHGAGTCVCLCVCESVRVCLCERGQERYCLVHRRAHSNYCYAAFSTCVCAWRMYVWACVRVCVRAKVREGKSVYVRKWERARVTLSRAPSSSFKVSLWSWYLCVWVVYVCVWVRACECESGSGGERHSLVHRRAHSNHRHEASTCVMVSAYIWCV